MSDKLLTDSTRMSGGEIEGPLKAAFDSMRRLITAEPDVHQLLSLAPVHEDQPEGDWLYLIETPFATFPRFVVGQTDSANQRPTILFQSGTLWSAADHWKHLTNTAP